jgi:hypothetical protein
MLLRLALSALLIGVARSVAKEIKPSYKYCVVGAGPGALQLGHYLRRCVRVCVYVSCLCVSHARA